MIVHAESGYAFGELFSVCLPPGEFVAAMVSSFLAVCMVTLRFYLLQQVKTAGPQ